VLMVLGLIVFCTGLLKIVIAGFKEHFVWGLSCVFLPPSMIAFVMLYPRSCIKPALISGIGMSIMLLVVMFSPEQQLSG